MLWDLFCTVIDNHGDLGVCWRLAAELARRGERVRLWVDDASALTWMAPDGQPGVSLRRWAQPIPETELQTLDLPEVVIEAFGCTLNPELIARYRTLHDALSQEAALRVTAPPAPPLWLNLEYLSAEPWVERCHGLPSPVLHGPGAGWNKWFFYPGFTPGTGGLIREADAVQPSPPSPVRQGAVSIEAAQDECRVSLFCYEPPGLEPWLDRLKAEGLDHRPCRLKVMPGRPSLAVQSWARRQGPGELGAQGWLRLDYRPAVPQPEFDAALRACELNFVRGEDSLVRALWAGQAFIWHIYPQDDGAHRDKLEAFLDWLQAPPELRAFHRVWNGLQPGPLPAVELASWRETALAARQSLLLQKDLVSQLLRFCTEKR